MHRSQVVPLRGIVETGAMAKAEITSLSANLLTPRASSKPMGRPTGIMNAREWIGRILLHHLSRRKVCSVRIQTYLMLA
jgi:hypothetical protein